MNQQSSLDRARELLANKFLLAVFGGIYVVSQVVIAILADRIGSDQVVALQVTGFTSRDYLEAFARWDAAGTMPFYHAHFIFDDLHWIWYSITLSVLLSLGLDSARLPRRWNPVIALPVVAGILDCIENGLQHVFLSRPDYVTLIDPLPAISAVASIAKWILFLSSFVLIAALFLRAWTGRGLPSCTSAASARG